MIMTVPEYIYTKSIRAGMTKEGACALLGNIQKESGFKPNNLEDRANTALGVTDEQYTQMVDNGQWRDFENDNGMHGGYGLVQTTLADRKKQFLAFMQSRGCSIGDLKGQVAFILWEMKSMYPKVWRTVTSSHDLYECTHIILYSYENPQEKEENMRIRYQYAQEWFEKLNAMEVSTQMTQNEAVKKVLDLARGEVGYHEQGENVTKYAAYLDSISGFYNGAKNGFAWCDVFVDYLFVKSFGTTIGREMICQPMQSAGAGCLYSAQYYKQAGRWVSQPQPGDQIFFSYAAGEYSHTGIVESVSGGTVTTIEGNSSDSVARRNYSLSNGAIVGYGRPKWELASGDASAAYDEIDVDESDDTVFSGYVTVILKKGSKGIDVRQYQEKLMELGYDLGKYGADGDFGNDTYKAVVAFQKDHGLEADGEIGPLTSAAIEEALGNGSTTTSASTAPVQTGTTTSKPTTVVTVPASSTTKPAATQKPNGSYKFNVGDIVNFIGNGCYMSPNAKVGIACKPGRMIITAVNRTAKHPYRIRPMQRFSVQGNGWVDEDALQAAQ